MYTGLQLDSSCKGAEAAAETSCQRELLRLLAVVYTCLHPMRKGVAPPANHDHLERLHEHLVAANELHQLQAAKFAADSGATTQLCHSALRRHVPYPPQTPNPNPTPYGSGGSSAIPTLPLKDLQHHASTASTAIVLQHPSNYPRHPNPTCSRRFTRTNSWGIATPGRCGTGFSGGSSNSGGGGPSPGPPPPPAPRRLLSGMVVLSRRTSRRADAALMLSSAQPLGMPKRRWLLACPQRSRAEAARSCTQAWVRCQAALLAASPRAQLPCALPSHPGTLSMAMGDQGSGAAQMRVAALERAAQEPAHTHASAGAVRWRTVRSPEQAGVAKIPSGDGAAALLRGALAALEAQAAMRVPGATLWC